MKLSISIHFLIALVLTSVLPGCGPAKHSSKEIYMPFTMEQFKPGQLITFRQVREAILAHKCLKCHSGQRARKGIRLDTAEEFLKHVDLVNPFSSPVLVQINLGEMPPRPRPPITDEEYEILKGWILQEAATRKL